MKTKQYIQAFTLSEMIIVLILTSIVIGLAFSTLRLIHQHMSVIQSNFSKNTELNLLETSLWLDFNRYSKVEYSDSMNALNFSNEIDSKTYLFEENYIIKGLDTFNIKTHSKTLFFNGNETEKGKVDALKLHTNKELLSQTIFVFKTNDATQFVN